MTSIRLTTKPAADVRADALVVFVEGDQTGFTLRPGTSIPRSLALKLTGMLQPVLAAMRPNDVRVIPSNGLVRPAVVAYVMTTDLGGESLRQAAGAAARALRGKSSLVVDCPVDSAEGIAAVAQGCLLGAYAYTTYLTSDAPTTHTIDTVKLSSTTARKPAVQRAVERAVTVGEAVCGARDLVNTPPADLVPQDFAAIVRRAASDTSIRVDVLDETKLARGGYGGILGVGKGSAHPPRLVRMTYRPPRAHRHLALVGKGVTFDSGGLSLKPPTAMITMKCDMGGAAAVAMATLAMARLKVPVKVTAYLPLVENMPSGTAQRPGDVLTTYNGTTVEVLNTDAEGRLIMADALARACEDDPDLLVDVATLTGAQMVALGGHIGAAMGNDDAPRDSVVASADRTGEALWPMPLPEPLRKSLDSKIADLANIGERNGGMLTAGLFLREFVSDGTDWVHLDIAGPAFNEGSPHGYTPAGGTGFAVRTLVQLGRDMAG